MPRIRVYEVATFYDMYNTDAGRPDAGPGVHDHAVLAVRLGRRGARPARTRSASASASRRRTGGSSCASSSAWVPAPTRRCCWIDDDFYEDIDYAGTKAILEALKRGERPTPGPQNGRQRLDAARRQDHARWSAGELSGMLQDRDRIFTNLYGEHAWGLEGAQAARRLGRHQGPDPQGPRLARPGDQGQRPARPRRRRLPDRPEMVVHAQAVGRAALSRRQRRRIRARDLQGPGDHAPRPAQAGRGLPDRRRRHGLHGRLHLHPRRVHPRGARLSSAPSTRPTRRGCSARTPAAPATTSTSTCTAAPAPTSAARRRRCSRASRARRASRA